MNYDPPQQRSCTFNRGNKKNSHTDGSLQNGKTEISKKFLNQIFQLTSFGRAFLEACAS